MAARLFGTDGVRGVANGDVLDPEVALALGRASALFARERGARPAASSWSGATRAARGRCSRMRCAPASRRPAASRCAPACCRRRASPGSCASRARASAPSSRPRTTRSPTTASSSSARDGFKLDDDEEDRVEALMGDASDRGRPGPASASRAALDGRRRALRDWVAGGGGTPIEVPALRVLVDCAQRRGLDASRRSSSRSSASSTRSPRAEPDGVNINDRVRLDAPRRARRARARRAASTSGSRSTATPTACSRSTPPGPSSTATRSSRCSRATCRSRARLAGDKVVVTSMSNLGFHRAMQRARHRDGRDRRRRPLRARGHARARRGARRRAVRARDRARPPDHRRRPDHGRRCCSTRSAATTSRWPRPRRSCARFPQVLVNVRADRTRLAGCTRGLGGRRARERRRSPRAAPGRIVLRAVRHRAAGARDGRARGRRRAASHLPMR